MMLLAIDPSGDPKGHTGIVLLWVQEDKPAELEESWAIAGGIEPMIDWFEKDYIQEILDDTDVIVVEHFVLYGPRGVDIGPAYVEGAIRGYAAALLSAEIVLQPASGKNTAVPDHAMDRAGFPKSLFKGDHHNDRWEALRHALWYLKRTDHRPTLLAMFPNV